MKPFSTEELARLQLSQEESMQDECVFQNYTEGALNAYGRPSSPFSTGISTKCGYQPVSESEAMGRGEVVIEDAILRLPLSLFDQIIPAMRIELTKRFGVLLASPELFLIIGKPKRGPSGLLVKLKRETQFTLFSLSSIFGLQLWYDSSDISSLFQDSAGTIPVTTVGDSIQLIVDKSGNSNNATQPVLSKRPTFIPNVMNGKSIARFDGVDDFMIFPPFDFVGSTVFIVFSTVRPGFNQSLFGEESTVPGMPSTRVDITAIPFLSGIRFIGKVSLFFSVVPPSWLVNQGKLLTLDISPSVGNMYMDGVSSTFPHSEPSLFFHHLGAVHGVQRLDGDIAEVVAYDSVLSSADRGDVHQYLTSKWGI